MNTSPQKLGRAACAAVALGLAAAGPAACEKKAPSTTGASTATPTAAAPASRPGGLPDVCKMFTNDEVGALVGSAIVGSKPDPQTKPGEPSCDWLNKDGGIVVVITLRPTTKGDFTGDAKGYEPVAGVGEGAYENHGILTVLHQTTEITVIFGGSGSVETQKKIAAGVIKKLGG